MKSFKSFGVVAALTVAFGAALAVPAAMADTTDRGALPEKHDSNTLHKIGKAVQYPVRKLGENTSKTAQKSGKATQYVARKTTENASVSSHQATGKKSVVVNRKHATKKVVTPTGHSIPAGHN